MKTLGIIGGLGPMATAYLLELIINMTDAKTDQEHIDAVVFNRPDVPDRTAYILDHSKPSPLPALQETARTLEQLGAGLLCTPCVTAHYFHRELAGSVSIPLLHMPRETAAELQKAGRKKIGVMATDGTIQSGLFQSAFSDFSLAAVLPSERGQAKVMSLIYDDVKAGHKPDERKFREVSEELYSSGADCIVLGCTELSMLKKYGISDSNCLDALEVLAKRSVEECGGKLKEEYRDLI